MQNKVAICSPWTVSPCKAGTPIYPVSVLLTHWVSLIEEEIRIEQKRPYFFLHFSIWHHK